MRSASATPVAASAGAKPGPAVAGTIDGRSVHLADVPAGTPFSVTLVGSLGSDPPTTWQGVSLNWYADVPPGQQPPPLSDDDRQAIGSIVTDVKDFYNRKSILTLAGDADRAVALVRLVRDSDFHAGKGEIVWRIELWYFENQAGGWAAVGQQNKVLRRERFKTAKAYQEATANLRFVPALGGIVAEPGKTTTVTLTKEQLAEAPAGYAGPPAPAARP